MVTPIALIHYAYKCLLEVTCFMPQMVKITDLVVLLRSPTLFFSLFIRLRWLLASTPYRLGPFVYALQCLTGKVDNNTDRIPSSAGLSRLDHQVWCVAGIRVGPCIFLPFYNKINERYYFRYTVVESFLIRTFLFI